MNDEPCCIIPTGNMRLLCLSVSGQQEVTKLQMEFRDYDGMNLRWRDVPRLYVQPQLFFKHELTPAEHL